MHIRYTLTYILISIFFNFTLSQNKNGIIEYSFTFENIKDSLKSKKNSDFINNISIASDQIKLELIFNSKESIFKRKEIMIPDNLNKTFFGIAQMLACSGEYYQKRLDSIQQITKVNGQLYLVNLNKQKWKITKETKKINNYNCIKATTEILNRNGKANTFVAWFAPEIPAPYGPRGFGGLPGLILELDLNVLIYKAKKVTFLKSVTIQPPKKGIQISEEEYNTLGSQGLEDFKNSIRN